MCVGWFSYRNSNSAMGHYRNGLDEGACLGIENFGQSIGILGHFGHFSGNDLYRFRMFWRGERNNFYRNFLSSKRYRNGFDIETSAATLGIEELAFMQIFYRNVWYRK
jgi:hypothetical protein